MIHLAATTLTENARVIHVQMAEPKGAEGAGGLL